VRVGNLNAERDFTDVRDVVRAYWLLIQQGEAGLCYNVGSGTSHSIRWLLDTLLELTPASIKVELDPMRLRPSDVPRSYCDNRRLKQATGWQPKIDLRTALQDLLDSWRAQLARS
jgi:GDP-4-dehydro-6-deoxy-D-mannose reductase